LLLALLVAALCGASALGQAPEKRRTESVFLVLIDGLRWQEVFGGADEALLNTQSGGVPEGRLEALKRSYWRESPAERREALMPFLWGTVAKQGQLIGNRSRGSAMNLTNPHHFSYPGYSEMIVGYVDPRIDSNNKVPNPNVSVFEWLHAKPRFRHRVAVFGSWDVVAWIVNRDRCGFFVNVGDEPVTQGRISESQALLNTLKQELHTPWVDWPFDAVTFRSAVEYIRANRPRAFWLTFGETDEFAHEGRYDHYLNATRRTDGYLKALWETLQGMEQYRGRTTLIAAVDHGRGRTPQDWRHHGKDYPGADEVWLAAIGPDTPPLGERSNTPTYTQSQIAATVAALLGEDYSAAVPRAGAPIAALRGPE
jgi:hypothetical protein